MTVRIQPRRTISAATPLSGRLRRLHLPKYQNPCQCAQHALLLATPPSVPPSARTEATFEPNP